MQGLSFSDNNRGESSLYRRLLSAETLALVLGLTAAVAAVLAAQVEAKYSLVFLAGTVLLFIFIIIGDRARLKQVFLAFFAISISMNLVKNFFYTRHVGGAPSISVTAADLFMYGMYALAMHDRLVSRAKASMEFNRPIALAICLFIASGVLSLINADFPGLVFFELFALFKLLLVFLIIASIRKEKELKTFIFFISASVLLEGILAVVQYKSGTSLGLGLFGEKEIVGQNIGVMVGRATGTIGHPNVLGYFFEILLPLMLSMMLVEENKPMRVWYFIVLSVGLAGIFTTLSRGAWITIPVSFTIVLFTVYRRYLLRVKTFFYIFLLGAVFLAGSYVAYPTIEKRLVHTDYRSTEARQPLNKAAFSIVKKFPVAGIGLNNFSEVFKRYDTTGHSKLFAGYKQVVHNMYLLVWAELGTVGLASFLWIFTVVLRTAVRSIRDACDWQKGVLTGISAGLLAHLIHGFFDPGFKTTSNISMLVYALFGVVGCISLLQKRRQKKDMPPEVASIAGEPE